MNSSFDANPVSKLTVGSLFAGIGGFDLGLERAGGFEVRWQVEIDDYCQRVLAKHWPHVKRYGDIRTVTDVERVDVLCGGFPCQDISNAGKRAGIDGERSGLWSEFVRLIRLVRPRYVIVENVAALLGRGIQRVTGDLAESGYDAEWDCIPACFVGAPHIRDRVWLVAYPSSVGRVRGRILRDIDRTERIGPNATKWGFDRKNVEVRLAREAICDPWTPTPESIGVLDGISSHVEQQRAVGNAVVPQIVQWIGERILDHERSRLESSR